MKTRFAGSAKNWILGIAIAVFFALFIGFGIEAFYPTPKFENVCANIAYDIAAESCPSQGKMPMAGEKYPESCYCDFDAKGVQTNVCHKTNPEYSACQQRFDSVNELYSRNLFIITSIIGLAAMIVGAFFLGHPSVSPGLMGGGFITIFYGTVRYWNYAGSKLRVAILGIILAMLIYLAYRKWQR
jgi:hypothetical protein